MRILDLISLIKCKLERRKPNTIELNNNDNYISDT